MRVSLLIGGAPYSAALPYANCDHVAVDMVCPACGAVAPLKIRGCGNTAIDHDTESADAVALCCRATVGRVVATFSTIFGIEEDRAVLCGRARVY